MAETEGAPWRDCSATDCSAVPRIEYCSHCLNRYNGFAPTADAVDASYCGVTQDGERGYTDVIAHDGSVIREPPVRATLTAGEELDVEFTITAHHKGHVELGVCCLDPQTTSAADMVSCFKDNKATFVRDEYYNAPVDENYPKRGYVAPPSANILGTSSASTGYSDMPFKMVYKLPEGQSGDRCLLQWMYYTGNSCEMPGYNDFAFPGDDWRQCGGVGRQCLSTCSFTGAPYGGERMVAGDRDDGEIGNVAPERFWNCADVAIRSSNGAVPAPATPDTTPAAPDAEAEPAPGPPPPAGSEDETSLTCANGWTCQPAGDGRWECFESPSASGDGEAEEDAPSPPLPASSEALVANWEQCGGINFCGGSDGPCRACADDWACKKEPGNDYYWQCVFPSYEFPIEEEPAPPPPSTDVADWGQCGGLSLCSADTACRDCASPTWKCLKQPGNPWYHQVRTCSRGARRGGGLTTNEVRPRGLQLPAGPGPGRPAGLGPNRRGVPAAQELLQLDLRRPPARQDGQVRQRQAAQARVPGLETGHLRLGHPGEGVHVQEEAVQGASQGRPAAVGRVMTALVPPTVPRRPSESQFCAVFPRVFLLGRRCLQRPCCSWPS